MPQLRHIDVDEVSLVGTAANKREFLLFKSADETEESMAEKWSDENLAGLEQALNTPVDGEDDLIAQASVSEEAGVAVKSAMRLLAPHKGDAVKEMLTKAGLGHDKPEPKPKVEFPKPEAAKKDVETPPAIDPNVSALLKEQNGVIEKQTAQLVAQGEDIKTLKTQNAVWLEKEKDRVVDELIKEHALPGDHKALRVLLKSLNPEQQQAWADSLKSGRAAIDKLGKEVGTSRRQIAPESAQAEIAAHLDAAVEKADDGADPMDVAMKGMAAAEKASPGIWDRARDEDLGGGR